MPVSDYHFENRIFFAREHGNISVKEAEAWAAMLKQHADASPEPIIALVDAMQVRVVAAAASLIFAQASHHPNVLLVAVAANAGISSIANVIGRIGVQGKTHVFMNLKYARIFSEKALANKAILDAID
jgi:hypothetical protein